MTQSSQLTNLSNLIILKSFHLFFLYFLLKLLISLICVYSYQFYINVLAQSPFIEATTPVSGPMDLSSPHLPKQGSPFYAEPADSLMPAPPPALRKVVKKTETPLNISLSPLQSFKLVNFRVKPESPVDGNEGKYYF